MNWKAGADEVEGIVVKTAANFKVYIETHQGKHTVPNWPGYNGVKGKQFKADLVAPGKTQLLLQLWNKVEPGVLRSTPNSGYGYVDCGTRQVGTDSETYATVQWAKVGNNYVFHAYPEPNKFKNQTYVNL